MCEINSWAYCANDSVESTMLPAHSQRRCQGVVHSCDDEFLDCPVGNNCADDPERWFVWFMVFESTLLYFCCDWTACIFLLVDVKSFHIRFWNHFLIGEYYCGMRIFLRIITIHSQQFRLAFLHSEILRHSWLLSNL